MPLTPAVPRARGVRTTAAMRDPQAATLSDLYDAHAGRCYRMARTICLDPHRAERAVQQAFLQARDSTSARGPHAPTVGRLLVTVYRCACVEARHSGQAYRPLPGLTPGQAQVMALARFGHLTCDEIAEAIGAAPADVKQLIDEGLRAFGGRQARGGDGAG